MTKIMCVIVILICAVTLNYYSNAINEDVHIFHNVTFDYGEEETELPLCTEHNEVYKEEKHEEDLTQKKLIKKNTFLKCICFRRSDISEESPVEYEDPIHPENKNTSYLCPLYNETNLANCRRSAVCQRDFYGDYGEEKPNETYIDYSVIYCNCNNNGRKCLAAYRSPNETTYKCASKVNYLRTCEKDEDHMVENYIREIFPNGTEEVKLNTSVKCSCNKPGETIINGLLDENYTRIKVDANNPNKFTAYHWCPEHLIPRKRVTCRENQVNKRTYLFPYGRDRPGYNAVVDIEFCNCGPGPQYSTANVRWPEEGIIIENNITHRCITTVCKRNDTCEAYYPYYSETKCVCNGECDFADADTPETDKKDGVYKYCKLPTNETEIQ